jgi:metal-responsive CopG/Arc/MetJ family transcriptional regulator
MLKNTHGGSRKGAGRKPEYRDRVKLQIVLDRDLLNAIDRYLAEKKINRSEFFQQLATHEIFFETNSSDCHQ